MTTIILDVPDELAERIQQVGQQLPQLLHYTMNIAGIPEADGYAASTATISPFLQEVADFLVGSPTPAQIVAFKASGEAQARVEELLDRNREESLTPQERSELDAIQSTNHLLMLLKIRARTAQQTN